MSTVLFLGFKEVDSEYFKALGDEQKSRYIWFVKNDVGNKIYLGKELYSNVYDDEDIKNKIKNLTKNIGLDENGNFNEEIDYNNLIEWLNDLKKKDGYLDERLKNLEKSTGVTEEIKEEIEKLRKDLTNEINESDKAIAYTFNKLKEKIGLTDSLELPEDFGEDGDTIIDKINEVSEKIVFASKEDIDKLFVKQEETTEEIVEDNSQEIVDDNEI